jgi:hypothetical protein
VPKGWSTAALAFAVVAGGTGCTADDGRVTLAFEPEEGAEGAGRLVELGVEDGEETATVTSHTRLAVDTTAASTTGSRTLVGTQTSDVTAT